MWSVEPCARFEVVSVEVVDELAAVCMSWLLSLVVSSVECSCCVDLGVVSTWIMTDVCA